MLRVQDWPLRLAAAIDEARARQFCWSVFDCVTFAFEVRGRLIGVDAAQQWRGEYRTLAGGLRVLRRMGHADLASLATAECGAPVPPLSAHRGDLVLLAGGEIGAMGVCVGAQVATVTEESGLVVVPLTLTVAAWRV